MSYFIRNGNTYRIASEEALDIQKVLPVGNYTVKAEPITGALYLEMVDDFPQIKKLYGDTTKNAGRILRTFMDRDVSTGVMLNGEKGSGKTLLAKTLSIDAALMGIPTIIINQPWTGDAFNKFLQDIAQPTVILFDEFEKVYDNEDQEKALTLLDGVFPSKKLFVITCNDKWRVNEHMRNRPGRIYYMLDFAGLSVEFIREYCEDVLQDKQHIQKICEITSLFDKFNFDMLKALVEEMNRYGETPQEALKMLNAKPEYNNASVFDVQLFIDGRELGERDGVDKKWRGNPLTGVVSLEWDTDPADDNSDWETSVFTPSSIKKVDAQEGRFSYTNEKNEVLVLTRQKETNYNYLAF